MKRILLVVLTSLSLGACSNLMDEVPSFYDDNESKAVIDFAYSVRSIDCASDQALEQVLVSYDRLQWLMTYSELKGSRDVLSVLTIVDKGYAEIIKKETISKPYCQVKKTNIEKQIKSISTAIFRRF